MSDHSTWMPLYIGDYLADTMHLSAEEHGAYLLLIMHYWRNNASIPDDSKIIKNICKISTQKSLKILNEFFVKKEDGWHHKRIDDEIAKAIENKQKSIKRTEAARLAKAEKSPSVTGNVTAIVTGSPPPSPSPEVSKSSDTNVSGAEAPPDDPPPDLKAVVFNQGIAWLSKATGKTEKALRPLVGKWVSEWGEASASAAMMDAQRCSAIEPIAYIEKVLKQQGKANANSGKKHRDTDFGKQDFAKGVEGFDIC